MLWSSAASYEGNGTGSRPCRAAEVRNVHSVRLPALPVQPG
ncbi:hypothetical protein [Streptomyces rubradiris]|nr:hypothetical protein [Streptomyces rubradiris]